MFPQKKIFLGTILNRAELIGFGEGMNEERWGRGRVKADYFGDQSDVPVHARSWVINYSARRANMAAEVSAHLNTLYSMFTFKFCSKLNI